MREYIIDNLKEHSSIKGKQKTWISELTDDQLYELYLRLRKDEPAKSIARYVQKVWKINPNSSAHQFPKEF